MEQVFPMSIICWLQSPQLFACLHGIKIDVDRRVQRHTAQLLSTMLADSSTSSSSVLLSDSELL